MMRTISPFILSLVSTATLTLQLTSAQSSTTTTTTTTTITNTEFSTTSCDATSELLARISLQTDQYPWETSWQLRDISTLIKNNGNVQQLNKVLVKGPPESVNYARGSIYVGTLCLERGHTFEFRMKDSMGDGICCSYGDGYAIVEIIQDSNNNNSNNSNNNNEEIVTEVVSHRGVINNAFNKVYEFTLPDVEDTDGLPIIGKATEKPTAMPTKSPTRPPTNRPTNMPVEEVATTGPRDVVSFIVMADIPYYTNHRYCLNKQLRELNPQNDNNFLFIVHLGDMKYGQERDCVSTYYSDVAEIFTHPSNALHYDPRDIFFLIGDNDWNDCNDPDQALSYWMNNFGNGEKKNDGVNTGPNPYGFGTLSRDDIVVEYDYQGNDQSSSKVYPSSASNFAFFTEGVLFVGLNQVGGGTIGDESERVANNFEWVKSNLNKYKNYNEGGLRTLVVFGHAHMSSARQEYFGGPFLSLLREEYPDILVVYMHGDGHEFDVGYADSQNPNVIQIEADSGEQADPLLMTITRDPQNDKDDLLINRRGGRYKDSDCDPGNRDQTWSSNSW